MARTIWGGGTVEGGGNNPGGWLFRSLRRLFGLPQQQSPSGSTGTIATGTTGPLSQPMTATELNGTIHPYPDSGYLDEFSPTMPGAESLYTGASGNPVPGSGGLIDPLSESQATESVASGSPGPGGMGGGAGASSGPHPGPGGTTIGSTGNLLNPGQIDPNMMYDFSDRASASGEPLPPTSVGGFSSPTGMTPNPDTSGGSNNWSRRDNGGDPGEFGLPLPGGGGAGGFGGGFGGGRGVNPQVEDNVISVASGIPTVPNPNYWHPGRWGGPVGPGAAAPAPSGGGGMQRFRLNQFGLGPAQGNGADMGMGSGGMGNGGGDGSGGLSGVAPAPASPASPIAPMAVSGRWFEPPIPILTGPDNPGLPPIGPPPGPGGDGLPGRHQNFMGFNPEQAAVAQANNLHDSTNPLLRARPRPRAARWGTSLMGAGG